MLNKVSRDFHRPDLITAPTIKPGQQGPTIHPTRSFFLKNKEMNYSERCRKEQINGSRQFRGNEDLERQSNGAHIVAFRVAIRARQCIITPGRV
jgi:hypothetical protein